MVGGFQEWEHRLLRRRNVFIPRAWGLRLAHELALLKIADLFMGTSSGFATFATFTDIAYAIVNVEHSFAGPAEVRLNDRHFPFAKANQVLTWQTETGEELLSLFDEALCRRATGRCREDANASRRAGGTASSRSTGTGTRMIRRLLLIPTCWPNRGCGIPIGWFAASLRSRFVGIAIDLACAAGRQERRNVRAADQDDELARRLWASPRLLASFSMGRRSRSQSSALSAASWCCGFPSTRRCVSARSADERNFSLRLSGPTRSTGAEEPADLAEPRSPVLPCSRTMAVRWISRLSSPTGRRARRVCSICSRLCSCWSAFAASRCSGTRKRAIATTSILTVRAGTEPLAHRRRSGRSWKHAARRL